MNLPMESRAVMNKSGDSEKSTVLDSFLTIDFNPGNERKILVNLDKMGTICMDKAAGLTKTVILFPRLSRYLASSHLK